ncbi:MAG TPA: WYL domain-containing protein [Actinotalea caeni]|uniref:helix-turn-helix transcriptional regulator n=1 Tax=Actinotalea caeni TaxID=1348467 RepID=UPI0012E15629|nr:WYL domain-containing protein [Actinotalea caeni]HLV54863.1 WYL domain-containing protein [Actinotalea caeni]
MSERVDAAERMLDLVIALSHTRHRMTKAEIRAKVNGYGSSTSDEAFERMFERDKEHLRQLGIPIVTLTDAVHEDEVGYRIDTAAYSLPPIHLSPAQMGVLSLAAEVWQDSTFASAARRGLVKLKAVADGSAAAAPGVTLRVRGPEPAMDDLLAAIAERAPVRFSYRAAYSGEVTVRTVEPWRVYARDRGWYLVGHDRDRDAQRSFRTSRIIGRVERVGEPGSVVIPEERVPTPERVFRVPVRLAVRPEGAAALRARGEVVDSIETPAGVRDVLALEVSDVAYLADEIAGYGDTVVVLDPPDLRASVLRRLRAVAALGEG